MPSNYLPRLLASALLLAAMPTASARAQAGDGRLSARPSAQASLEPAADRGHVRLPGLPRDTQIYVPSSYEPGKSAPALLLLHGAGGSARQDIRTFIDAAETYGLILIAPQASAKTWDIIAQRKRNLDGSWLPGDFGADARRINTVLTSVFSRYDIDPARMAIAGFSDGASYALALGTINRELFPSIIAFSPGFAPSKRRVGRQRVFVSHGMRDTVLPFAVAQQLTVPSLRALRLDVTFRTFDGGHGVPADILRDALAWFLGPSPTGDARKAE